MTRLALRLLLFLGLVSVCLPFIVSSLLLDQRGIFIGGRIIAKDERVIVHYSGYNRLLELTVQYQGPEEASVGFLKAKVSRSRFDEARKGDRVQLRYLPSQDLPRLPAVHVLREMHVLPTVRMADQSTWSGLQLLLTGVTGVVVGISMVVVMILVLWRMAGIPGFTWAVACCVLVAIAAGVVNDFPTATPAPRNNVRSASGSVKNVDQIDWLFRHEHDRGVQADQPIEAVSVQFVPAGRTEPVVAFDLIDAGSITGLRTGTPVQVDYEQDEPRTAYVRGASRQFARRNLQGIVVQAVASVAVIAALLFAFHLLRRGYRRLTR